MNKSNTSWVRDELTQRVTMLEMELEDNSDRKSPSG